MMKSTKTLLIAAAMAGALAALPVAAFADATHSPLPTAGKDKNGCRGKDGCSGKDKKKDTQKDKKKDKSACAGKDGCGGKDKKS
jgi:Spy/CpxP family protein refolding chaperone